MFYYTFLQHFPSFSTNLAICLAMCNVFRSIILGHLLTESQLFSSTPIRSTQTQEDTGIYAKDSG